MRQSSHLSSLPRKEVFRGIFRIVNRTLLRLDDVEVQRSGSTILGPLSWEVTDGQRWVVLGANGAGKTTLLQLIHLIFYDKNHKLLHMLSKLALSRSIFLYFLKRLDY